MTIREGSGQIVWQFKRLEHRRKVLGAERPYTYLNSILYYTINLLFIRISDQKMLKASSTHLVDHSELIIQVRLDLESERSSRVERVHLDQFKCQMLELGIDELRKALLHYFMGTTKLSLCYKFLVFVFWDEYETSFILSNLKWLGFPSPKGSVRVFM